jgi:hypothetical protein
MSTQRHMQVALPQGSVPSPTLYNLYINDTPKTHGVDLDVPISDRAQAGLCFEKSPTWSKFNGGLV